MLTSEEDTRLLVAAVQGLDAARTALCELEESQAPVSAERSRAAELHDAVASALDRCRAHLPERR